MSEKVLQIAQRDILNTIKKQLPEISNEEALRLSEELLEAIDWENPALMHKSISWIARFYLQRHLAIQG